MKKPAFNRTYSALLAAIGLGLAPTQAEAVHLSPNGTGQVLIFPYYTARGGFFTALALTNTTEEFKALKVRFLEARNGRQVMDVNVYLSPRDMWTAGVIATTSGARLVGNDNSCVTPNDLFTTAGKGDFYNSNYLGDGDPFGNSLDRTREGYIEVIEMGISGNALIQSYVRQETNSANANFGSPMNCAAMEAMDPGSAAAVTKLPGNFFQPPTGGLSGRVSIIDSANGANYTVLPTALDAWSNVVQYAQVGSVAPALGAATPAESTILVPQGVIKAQWTSGRDAVSAVLMRDSLSNEFINDTGTASLTDWVVVFPTKREYKATALGAASALFIDSACETVGNVRIANRETRSASYLAEFCYAVTNTPLSKWMLFPSKASALFGASGGLIDYAANQATSISGPQTSTPHVTQGPNGWIRFPFVQPRQRLTPISATLNGQPLPNNTMVGLPVIGVGFHNYNRSGVISTYGGVIPSTYTQSAMNGPM